MILVKIYDQKIPKNPKGSVTDFPQKVVIVREMGPFISGKSRLVKYYSIWPDDSTTLIIGHSKQKFIPDNPCLINLK